MPWPNKKKSSCYRTIFCKYELNQQKLKNDLVASLKLDFFSQRGKKSSICNHTYNIENIYFLNILKIIEQIDIFGNQLITQRKSLRKFQ